MAYIDHDSTDLRSHDHALEQLDYWKCRLCGREFTTHKDRKSNPKCPNCKTQKVYYLGGVD